jgi:hypothetical protein
LTPHSTCASSDASTITPISVTANLSRHDQLPPSLAHKKDAGRRVVKGVPPAPADGVI